MKSDHKRKIVELTELIGILDKLRASGKVIVQCHGCFDIVHPGHLRYLEFARRQGDLLVVTLTGDAAIEKGEQRPHIPQELRAETLAALEFVDHVYIDPSPTAESVLEALQPNIYVKGREYETSRDERFLSEKSIVESKGGKVIFSSGDVVFSSTKLIDSIQSDEVLAHERLTAVCNRHEIDQNSTSTILDKIEGLRVGVVGDVILDRYVFCDAKDVADESAMLSLSQIEERRFVGGAAIVARHAAAMGADTFLLSCLADDDDSQKVAKVLSDEGVGLNALLTRPGLVQKTRFLVEESKLLKVESGESVPLDSVSEREASRVLEGRSRDLDAMIICDFGYGTVTASLLARVLPCLRANVPIIAADVSGSRGSLLRFRHVDLMCPTERELRHTLHDFDRGMSNVAYQLLQQTQARHLICTLGKRGLVAFDRASQDETSPNWDQRLLSDHFASFADRAIDRLGCGDALLAVSTLALAAKGSLIQAAYLGNAASAIEIEQLGNQPISSDMMRHWLSQRTELNVVPKAKKRMAPTRT
ncbi:MAG: bifunctional protein HldE [Phycisphaerae bacterium]|nr:MAG: bifunctional protein HldE [Phycisphaerae bacterium]